MAKSDLSDDHRGPGEVGAQSPYPGIEAMHNAPQHADSQTGPPKACPFLGLPGNPARHFPIPCDANVCHVDPLGRRGYADLPLTCQVDFCLSPHHSTCRYWRNAQSPTLGVGRFLLSQVLVAGSACLRRLRA